MSSVTNPTIRFEKAVPQFKVPDLVRAAEYYRDVLGFQIAGYWDGERVSAVAAREPPHISGLLFHHPKGLTIHIPWIPRDWVIVEIISVHSQRRHKTRTATEASGCKRWILLVEQRGGSNPDLRIAKWTLGKNVSYCLFESCSHRGKSLVFTFLPIPSHRFYVVSCYFCPRIGHLES